VCAEEGCRNAVHARKLCSKHYRRWLKHGSTEFPGDTCMEDRFRRTGWTEVLRSLDTPCWEWRGTISVRGYGRVSFMYRHLMAHRFSYEIHCGPIPLGYVVRHRCDNPPCVNPEHLETGTQGENLRDMVERDRMPRGSSRPNALLSWGKVEEIRSSQETGAALAKKFGVSRSVVSNVRRNKTWKNPPCAATGSLVG